MGTVLQEGAAVPPGVAFPHVVDVVGFQPAMMIEVVLRDGGRWRAGMRDFYDVRDDDTPSDVVTPRMVQRLFDERRLTFVGRGA